MKQLHHFVLFVISLAGVMLSVSTVAAEIDDPTSQSQIKSAVAAYEQAFNDKDVEALKKLWTQSAVYSPSEDQAIVGREAIGQRFVEQFAAPGQSKLKLASESIEFVSPSVAVEKGLARVVQSDAEPTESEYTAIYVRQGNEWLLDRVSESEDISPTPSHFEKLASLEWLVGDWIDDTDQTEITTEVRWTRNQNFLMRAFTARGGDRVELSGMQFIGWDPIKQQIRSWLFDSDGGFAEGEWTEADDHWTVRSNATLPGGRQASSVTILKLVDPDRFIWKQVNRVVNGELLPNTDEIEIIRLKQ